MTIDISIIKKYVLGSDAERDAIDLIYPNIFGKSVRDELLYRCLAENSDNEVTTFLFRLRGVDYEFEIRKVK